MFIAQKNTPGISRYLVIVVVGMVLCAPLQAADDPWRFCGPSSVVNSTVDSARVKNQAESSSREMQFTADQARVEGGDYLLQGNVVGGRGNQQLSTDRLQYNAETDTAKADGNVRYQSGGRLLVGGSASLQLNEDSGYFSPARFWLMDRHIRGEAETIYLEGPTVTRLESAQFTTCNDGSNDWLLKASSLRLDTGANEGIAHHARIEFMHVPIFYFPYLSFPLAGRKTGFLVPSIGETSVAGTEISVPWYWSMAPQRDATLIPRIMTRRGVLMEGEFRYLTEHSQGQLDLAHISNDRVFGEDRSAMKFAHSGEPATGWRTRVDYRYASDVDYLDDFGAALSTTSETHLERRGEVNYRADSWSAGLLLQGYQTLDETLPKTSRPYQRLPQLRLSTVNWSGPAGLSLGLNAEAVRFHRAEGVVGSRYDVQPHISWPLRGAPGFLAPKLTLRHTQYALKDADPTVDDNPSRTVPVFSLDSGLVFERDLTGWGRARLQTLEPRLFYLYTPKREQSDLIVDESGNAKVFDSSLPLFGFNQLFRENRFNGGDRVADANQLSVALSSRFYNEKGRELLSASLGRILYFRDREVTLPGGLVETDAASDWVAELKSHWTERVSTRASLQWNKDDKELERGTLDWRYQKDRRRVLRYGYRFERESLKQFDAAFMWPIAARWNLVGRWLRSVGDHVTLETLKGVEYESCCWAVRLVQRNFRVDTADEELSQSIWIQLELKGLTSVGRRVEDLLVRDILAP
jgi:LPS-assembly protein